MATTSVSCRRENLSDTKIQATKLQRLAERREARRAQRGREKKARARREREKEMENAFEINVPLIVDIGIGNNWLEAH